MSTTRGTAKSISRRKKSERSEENVVAPHALPNEQSGLPPRGGLPSVVTIPAPKPAIEQMSAEHRADWTAKQFPLRIPAKVETRPTPMTFERADRCLDPRPWLIVAGLAMVAG